jgi:asparagine synthase (glutamine-hydrolysing)
MADAIYHRGPDEDGYLVDEYVSLGMRRLSIIDIAHGTQPIFSLDKRYAIFFNGEVYNYKELKEELLEKGKTFETDSDTEVVLRMYETYGPEMLPRLRGMFGFAIYDTLENKACIARDFFGIKPIYYWKNGDKIRAFGSEIKSFTAHPDWKPVINDDAVYNYLFFQYNPLTETFFKDVYKLPPAHYMLVDGKTGSFEIKRYAKFEFAPNENLDYEKTRESVLSTMRDSVEHHMIADVPVGSFLSGGIDSSIIATLMQEIRGGKKIKTFTVGFDTLTEANEARETSEPLGTEHTEIKVGKAEYFKALEKAVWHFDEPVADPSAIGLYFLAQEARKHVTVVLSGEGSDELFGGYNIYQVPLSRSKMAWMPKFVLQAILKLPFEFRGKNYIRRVSMKLEDWYFGQKYFNKSIFQKPEIAKLWKGEGKSFASMRQLYSEIGGISDSAKMQYIDINTWLIGDILAKADKMTMAHSLELRVPFLDKEVASLARTLPDKFKWKNGATKYILREAFRSVLPESTRTRRKLGFPTPVKGWFDDKAGNIYDTILLNPYIKEKMDIGYIEETIREHVEGRADNSRKIYILLMLSLWYNTFIK